jgi:hypothetical protein
LVLRSVRWVFNRSYRDKESCHGVFVRFSCQYAIFADRQRQLLFVAVNGMKNG